MPRQAILEAPGILYQVMIRGMEGRRIFRDTQDRKDLVTRLWSGGQVLQYYILALRLPKFSTRLMARLMLV
jgi:hypothetical protein